MYVNHCLFAISCVAVGAWWIYFADRLRPNKALPSVFVLTVDHILVPGTMSQPHYPLTRTWTWLITGWGKVRCNRRVLSQVSGVPVSRTARAQLYTWSTLMKAADTHCHDRE